MNEWIIMLFVYILQPSNYTIFHFPSPSLVTEENIIVCNIYHLQLTLGYNGSCHYSSS
jgi:hypothetical protein